VVSYSDDEIKDAARIEKRIREKLLAIIDLQGDIDELIRDCPQSPFRAANFTNARPEELQRMALIAATQLVLFEPKDWVKGNDRFAGLAEDLLDHVIRQIKWVKKKYR
jgi:hypothetical protein